MYEQNTIYIPPNYGKIRFGRVEIQHISFAVGALTLAFTLSMFLYMPISGLSGLEFFLYSFATSFVAVLTGFMHVVEHIGLGRYGDPLDTKGDIRAIRELKRVLARGGDLLFVVPVGKPRVMFNAHRIYSYEQIISYFQDLELIEFALIPNRPDGGLLRQADPQRSKDAEYDCGCFWFRKPNA